MNAKRILFLVAHPPHRGALAFEMLDALLVAAVFEQKVSVLFSGDGLYQLLDTGQPYRDVARSYRALPAYDVNDIYVDKTAMRQRSLTVEALVLPVRVLTRRGIRALIAAQDVVVPD
jgi:tRNA 2-thiouridine synthesizing protein C